MKYKETRKWNTIKYKINLIIILLVIILLSVFYCYNNINKNQDISIYGKYEKEDIESIDKVRDFFICFYGIEKYDISVAHWGKSIYNKYDGIIDEAIMLLKKYDELKLDKDKVLAYNKENRNIQIIHDTFVIDTPFCVDIKTSIYNYGVVQSIVTTQNGTWARIDTGIPKYILYLFGNEIKEIEINNVSGLLEMIYIKSDSQYYLFKEEIKEVVNYYVYKIKEDEWIKFDSHENAQLYLENNK